MRGRYGMLAALLLHAGTGLAGDYALLHGRDPVCREVLGHLAHAGAPAATLERLDQLEPVPTFALPPPLNQNRARIYDFNNDGRADRVFRYDGAGSYLFGTLLYVVYGEAVPGIDGGVARLSDVHIFPCRFDPAVHASSACAPVSQEADGAGVRVQPPGAASPVFFNGRYTDITPVRYRGRTYLILRGVSGPAARQAAVIEPSGSSGYASTCLFRR